MAKGSMTVGEEIIVGLEEDLEDLELCETTGQGSSTVRYSQVEVSEVNVKELRASLRLTQQQFTNVYGFKFDSVCEWEMGQSIPHGPDLVLLKRIKMESVL